MYAIRSYYDLPASSKPPSLTKEANVSIDHGKGTILLVDDEVRNNFV